MALIPGASTAPSIHPYGLASGSTGSPTALLLPYGLTGVVGNVRSSSSTAQTLVNADNDIQIFTPTAAHDVNLPTTDVASGRAFYIVNKGGYALTIKSSNGNTVVAAGTGTVTSGVYVVRSLQATPTTSAHWLVEYVYETGTWTPTIFGTAVAGAGTYTNNVGLFTRTNNTVNVLANLLWTAHTGSGNARFTLPFTSAAGPNNISSFVIGYMNNYALTASNIGYLTNIPSNATMEFYQYPTGGGASTAVALDTAAQIIFSGTYFV